MTLPFVEAKNCSRNIQSNVLSHSSYIAVKSSSHEFVIAENECLLGVESGRNDVLHIVLSVALYSLDRPFWAAKEVLFIICQHDDQWYVEDIL
jgi:hypothetical protein